MKSPIGPQLFLTLLLIARMEAAHNAHGLRARPKAYLLRVIFPKTGRYDQFATFDKF